MAPNRSIREIMVRNRAISCLFNMVNVELIGEVVNRRNILRAKICMITPEKYHSEPNINLVIIGANIPKHKNGINPMVTNLLTVFLYTTLNCLGE